MSYSHLKEKPLGSLTNLTVSGDGTWKKTWSYFPFWSSYAGRKIQQKIVDSCVKSLLTAKVVFFGKKEKRAILKLTKNGHHYTKKNVMLIIRDLPQKLK